MAVGFSVDFTAHITYAFSIAPGTDKNDRVRQALYSLGVPILQAAVSTILALLVLSNSFAYIFRVFFSTIFLTMAFGALHGLVFIPVVLSIIGPPQTCCDNCREEVITDVQFNRQKKPPADYSIHNVHNNMDITSPYWSRPTLPIEPIGGIVNPMVFDKTPYIVQLPQTPPQSTLWPGNGQWAMSKSVGSFQNDLLGITQAGHRFSNWNPGYWSMQYHSAYELNGFSNVKNEEEEDSNSDIYDREMFVNTVYEKDNQYSGWVAKQ